jgi:hypothetical protein
MKQSVVYCTQPVRGKLYFRVASAGEDHYLFTQPFRLSLWNRYRFGVRLEDALDWSRCGTPAGRKVCEKLFKWIRSIEKEYGIALLRKSRKPSRRTRREDAGIAA